MGLFFIISIPEVSQRCLELAQGGPGSRDGKVLFAHRAAKAAQRARQAPGGDRSTIIQVLLTLGLVLLIPYVYHQRTASHFIPIVITTIGVGGPLFRVTA